MLERGAILAAANRRAMAGRSQKNLVETGKTRTERTIEARA
ncbi:hypothetical protein [Jatrophihabitans cynanchi]|jgi:hypothetical protein|nr:hypothetical protein [Jatrophihabitans sp. SB3-54]